MSLPLEVVIRRARRSDLPSLLHLASTSFASEIQAQGITAKGMARTYLALTMANGLPLLIATALARYRLTIIVAELRGEVVGGAVCGGMSHLSIHALAVNVRNRHCGIGRLLVHSCESYARAVGWARVCTVVGTNNNPSLSMFLRLGYLPVGHHTLWRIPAQASSYPANDPILAFSAVCRQDKMIFGNILQQVYEDGGSLSQDSTLYPFFASTYFRLLQSFFLRMKSWKARIDIEGTPEGFVGVWMPSRFACGIGKCDAVTARASTYLPEILRRMARVCFEAGHLGMLVEVPDQQPLADRASEEAGGVKIGHFVRLVKNIP